MKGKILKPYVAKNVGGNMVAGFINQDSKTFIPDMVICGNKDLDMFLDKYNLAVICMGTLPEGVCELQSDKTGALNEVLCD